MWHIRYVLNVCCGVVIEDMYKHCTLLRTYMYMCIQQYVRRIRLVIVSTFSHAYKTTLLPLSPPLPSLLSSPPLSSPPLPSLLPLLLPSPSPLSSPLPMACR